MNQCGMEAKVYSKQEILASWYSFSIIETSFSWMRKGQSFSISLSLICCNIAPLSWGFTAILSRSQGLIRY